MILHVHISNVLFGNKYNNNIYFVFVYTGTEWVISQVYLINIVLLTL